MAVKGTMITPPEDMTEETVREAAKGLFAALQALKAKPASGQETPEVHDEKVADDDAIDDDSMDDDGPDTDASDPDPEETEND